MMIETINFPAVGVEFLADDTIRLSGPTGPDGQDVIDLHGEQVKFIARRLCGSTESDAAHIVQLERRLSVLAGKIETLVCADWTRSTLLECGADGEMVLARLDALADLAIEFDGGRLEPESLGDGKPIYPTPNSTVRAKPITDSGTSKSATTADSASVGATSEGQLCLIESEFYGR